MKRLLKKLSVMIVLSLSIVCSLSAADKYQHLYKLPPSYTPLGEDYKKANTYEEKLEILNEWALTDARLDSYLESANVYMNMAETIGKETHLDVEFKNEFYKEVLDTEHQRMVLAYPDGRFVDVANLDLAKLYFGFILDYYPQRLDVQLHYILADIYFKQYHDIAYRFTDIIKTMDALIEKKLPWQGSFNEEYDLKGEDIEHFTQGILLNALVSIQKASITEGIVTVPLSEVILQRWPSDSRLLTIISSYTFYYSPSKALNWSEKAYTIDKNNHSALAFASLSAYLLEDYERAEKYEKLLLATNDKQVIELYYSNKSLLK